MSLLLLFCVGHWVCKAPAPVVQLLVELENSSGLHPSFPQSLDSLPQIRSLGSIRLLQPKEHHTNGLWIADDNHMVDTYDVSRPLCAWSTSKGPDM